MRLISNFLFVLLGLAATAEAYASDFVAEQMKFNDSPNEDGPQPKRIRQTWTPEEDAILHDTFRKYGQMYYPYLSEKLPHRTYSSCFQRFARLTEPLASRDPAVPQCPLSGSPLPPYSRWTPDEDERLKGLLAARRREHFRLNGSVRWSVVARSMPGRTGKQCREHWSQCLDPRINRNKLSPEECELLYQLVFQQGRRDWSEMAKEFFKGRSQRKLQHWYANLTRDERRKFQQQAKERKQFVALDASDDSHETSNNVSASSASSMTNRAPIKRDRADYDDFSNLCSAADEDGALGPGFAERLVAHEDDCVGAEVMTFSRGPDLLPNDWVESMPRPISCESLLSECDIPLE